MKQARFTVLLNRASDRAIQVDFSTRDGTAKAGQHYEAVEGTLNFAPGTTTQDVVIPVIDPSPTTDVVNFTVELSRPVNATLGRYSGVVHLNERDPETSNWAVRFNWAYTLLTSRDGGYFGPTTGPNAYMTPYHAKERAVITEAPDWTHESVSETASFWVKLESWKYVLSGDISGLNRSWTAIERVWIPDDIAQPWNDYDPTRSADYLPDPLLLTDTPVVPETTRDPGSDPLANALEAAYGTKSVYLMHWLIDVDGDYGFKNPNGDTVNVFINNFQRGPVEDGMASITHPCFDDFENGGGEYGYQPIYNRALPVYPDGIGEYNKQVNYSMAGDADVRAVGSTYLALRNAPNAFSTALTGKASKMADYIRYTLHDKYFQPIPGFDQDGCHYLLSWGCGWGVGLPVEAGVGSYWGFRVGNSEIHHGYNGLDVAYAARTGAELAPIAAGAPAMWATSFDRQLELLRWLQSPEGAIAGGVTSNYKGSYSVPTDGRESAPFYGCYYNHSPSWFNPFSNDWTGFQFWGMQRVSEVMIHALEKGSTEADIAYRCGVLLDKWIPWFYNNCAVDLVGDRLRYPTLSSWVSDSVIPGVTASEPSPRYHGLPENPPVDTSDVYEYLPTLEWPGSNPDYSAFWSHDGSVPNPNLKCVITNHGWDHGTAAGAAQVLLQYCHAKELQQEGTLTGNVPNSDIPLAEVRQLAVNILEFCWRHRDGQGFGNQEPFGNMRLNDLLWIPPEFGSHEMPNGEVLENDGTTFLSMRESMYSTSEKWTELKAWLDSNGTTEQPSIVYHRFWVATDVAVAFAMAHQYFPNLEASETTGKGGGAFDPEPEPEGMSYLTAVGSDLVDRDGQKVILKAANWYGMEGILVPAILWSRAYKSVEGYVGILDQLAESGFNALRLPICEDVTWPGRTIKAGHSINAGMNPDFLIDPDFIGGAGPNDLIPSIEILDKILEHCESLNIRVIIDMHCLAPNEDNVAGTGGKWYSTTTPDAPGSTGGITGEPRNEEQWIQAWEFLADRYKDRAVVAGFDLINEPHNCTWDRDPLTGIVGAYERCAARIQAINPDVLIVCEGIAGNVEFPLGEIWGSTWSSNLSEVRTTPVEIPIQNKLVYSPHDYANYGAGAGPTWIYDPRFPEIMEYVLDTLWGFIAKEDIAPIFLGEFGGNFRLGETISIAWMQQLSDYCIDTDVSWAYWAVPGNPPTGLQGILSENHQSINATTVAAIQGMLDHS